MVKTPGGYLMVYAGFDGDVTRLHMATSLDGRQWVGQGTIMQRGPEDAVGASHPCLVMAGERWWLFFTGYDGSKNNRRAAVLAAVSQSGASWADLFDRRFQAASVRLFNRRLQTVDDPRHP